MSYFDVDEHIKKKRKKEKLFSDVKDSRTGDIQSYPLVEPTEEDEEKENQEDEVQKKEKEEIGEKDPLEKEEEKPRLQMEYDTERVGKKTVCEFEMVLGYGLNWDIPGKIKDWVDERIDLKDSAKVYLKRENPDETPPVQKLVIEGSGHDNRCRWCRSFWTSIVTASKDGSFKIEKENTCIFQQKLDG